MNIRAWLVVPAMLMGACAAAFGQDAAAAAEPAPVVAPESLAAPALEAAPPAVPAGDAMPVPDDLMQKIVQVNEQMDKDAAAAPAAMAPEARAAESRFAVDGGAPGGDAAAGTSRGFGINGLRALGSLLLVLALIAGLTYLLKRYGRKTALFAGASLGKSLGKMYLAPRVSLHFVETGGKVLVIGVNSNSLTPVASFEALEFHAVVEAAARASEQAPEQAASASPSGRDAGFLAELRSVMQDMEGKPHSAQGGGFVPSGDARELAALRGEVQRLQRRLQDTTGADAD